MRAQKRINFLRGMAEQTKSKDGSILSDSKLVSPWY